MIKADLPQGPSEIALRRGLRGKPRHPSTEDSPNPLNTKMATVFFSYSHANETQRNKLELHFAMLKREGLVETWHDRRLNAGDEFDRGILKQLEEADIILFLVSPEFLASRYCFEVELKRALERHESREARVIPVILEPCDWHASPLSKLLAVPRDGKPVSKYTNANEAYLEVVQAIRAALQELEIELEPSAVPEPATANAPIIQGARSSNLGIRKEFTAHERDQFLLDGFEFMQRFFEGSLDELMKRNSGLKVRYRLVDANRFTAEIYLNGEQATSCTIAISEHRGAGRHSITYSSGIQGNTGSYGDAISVADDERTLGFRAMNGGFLGQSYGRREEILSFEGAAEYLWGRLIQPLQ
jgi:hypothetical protein